MIKHFPIVAVVVTFSTFLLFPIAAQADTMRCDRSLITRGDHQGEVLASCGEPVISTRKTTTIALEFLVAVFVPYHQGIISIPAIQVSRMMNCLSITAQWLKCR